MCDVVVATVLSCTCKSYSYVNSCCSVLCDCVISWCSSPSVQLVCTVCVAHVHRCTHTLCFLINGTLLCTRNDPVFYTGKPHLWMHFTPEQFYLHMYVRTWSTTQHTLCSCKEDFLELEEVGGSAKCRDSHC